MTKSYAQLEAELEYAKWQRDRLAEALRVISERLEHAKLADWKTRGEVIGELVMEIMEGGTR